MCSQIRRSMTFEWLLLLYFFSFPEIYSTPKYNKAFWKFMFCRLYRLCYLLAERARLCEKSNQIFRVSLFFVVGNSANLLHVLQNGMYPKYTTTNLPEY